MRKGAYQSNDAERYEIITLEQTERSNVTTPTPLPRESIAPWFQRPPSKLGRITGFPHHNLALSRKINWSRLLRRPTK